MLLTTNVFLEVEGPELNLVLLFSGRRLEAQLAHFLGHARGRLKGNFHKLKLIWASSPKLK